MINIDGDEVDGLKVFRLGQGIEGLADVLSL